MAFKFDTQEKVDRLCRDWRSDPCYDLDSDEVLVDVAPSYRSQVRAYVAQAKTIWEADHAAQEKKQRAFGRTPVGMTKNVWPIVACRDGSVWELTSLPVDGEKQVEGQRLEMWRQLPPIPGSIADLNHDYWTEGGDK